MDYEVLVNKNNPLSKDFYPENLIDTQTRVANYRERVHEELLVDTVFLAFKEMQIEAFKKGYDIEIVSGFRSYDYQQTILDEFFAKKGEEAYKIVALPGTSEHQSGLAFDVGLFIDGNYVDDVTGEHEEIKWLHDNCSKYGFILRYPKGKEETTGFNYEPWHFRYVGTSLAKHIYETKITLEEYYNINEKKKVINHH